MVSTDAQIVLRDRYETTFNIYNHAARGADHPFALILMNWNEDTITNGELHEKMNRYIDADIQKYFGIDFNTWIDQPTYVIELQLEVARTRIEKEGPGQRAALEALRTLQSNK